MDIPTIKPIDEAYIRSLLGETQVILTAEEHNIFGGLGSVVAEVMAEHPSTTRLMRHGIRDEFSLIAPPTHLYAHYKLDINGVYEVAKGVLNDSASDDTIPR